jgi:hypothetical protein
MLLVAHTIVENKEPGLLEQRIGRKQLYQYEEKLKVIFLSILPK